MGAVKKPFSPSLVLYLSAGQVALAVIIAAVTSQQLDTGDCLLNIIPGRVCDFVYATVGFSLLFTLMVAVPTFIWQSNSSRANSVPLVPEAGHLALFGAFWWLVLATTITIRGGQAGDLGYAGGAARGAAIGLSWIQMVFFLATAAVVFLDRFQQSKQKRGKEDDDRSSEPSSGGDYVYTQALAHLPVK